MNASQTFDFIINAHKNMTNVTVTDTLCAVTAWRASGGRVAIIQLPGRPTARWVVVLDGEYLTRDEGTLLRRWGTAQKAADAALKACEQ